MRSTSTPWSAGCGCRSAGTRRRSPPAVAQSIPLADARHGGDAWRLVVVAFALPADADAFAAGALEASGPRGDAEFGPATLQAALRARASDAVVDTVAHHGLQVVRLVVTRPFAAGVGMLQDRPAAPLNAMLGGVMRLVVPWVVR